MEDLLKTMAGNGVSSAVLGFFLWKLAPEMRAIWRAIDRMKRTEPDASNPKAFELAIDQNTMAASPITEGQDGYPGQSGYSGYSGEVIEAAETQTVYTCECGKEFPKPQGLSMHKSQHCPLREQKTEA